MIHDIIDNQKTKLVEHINSLLKDSDRAKFAVGYFFASGLKPIIDEIEKLKEIKLLIGNVSNIKTVEALALIYPKEEKIQESLDKQTYLTPNQKNIVIEENKKGIAKSVSKIAQSDKNEEFIKKIATLIKNKKLKVKVYLPHPLHAKVYIFDFKEGRYDKGKAITGSSNLSLPGLTTNTELNVVVHGNENHAKLTKWFESLWEDAEEFNDDFIKVIENSWALAKPTPFELYIKVLYELFGERLEMEKRREEKKLTVPSLYIFQKDAVNQAFKILDKYNGLFISDVVGTGKTYVTCEILSRLKQKAVVVCPPSLQSYWQDIAYSFDVPIKTISFGKIDDFLEDEILIRDTQIVVVDEAHHFRNPNTKRYQALAEACFGKRVILVTATPYNLSPDDIYWQIKLFHPAEHTDIPIDPPVLRKFFKRVEKGEENLRTIFWPIMVRRTRNDIKRYYAKDIREGGLRFPERMGPFRIEYSIDEVYPGIYNDIVSLLKSLKYSRYSLGNYVKTKFRDERELTELKSITPQLVAIMKTLVLKRLESSIAAFRATINTFINVYKAFQDALSEDIVLAGPESDALLQALIAGDEETFRTLLEEREIKYDIKKFESKKLEEDLLDDLEILEEIIKLIGEPNPKKDKKLTKLLNYLKEKLKEKEKILIFSQYETTTNYIGREVSKEFERVQDVSSKTHNITEIVKRFAPKANQAKGIKPEDEIRILITTDVLSEGLNLQDADTVMNYDLHWNPVRMIQRVGRIDRIGTEYDEIFVYNFFPERDLEKHLGIEDKVSRRIQDIHDFLGEDAKLLSSDERLNPEGIYGIYKEEKEAMEEEDFEHIGIEDYTHFLKNLKENEPSLYQKAINLSPKVRSAKRGERGTIVFCKYGNYYQFYLINNKGQIKRIGVDNGLSLMQAEKETERLNIPKGFNETVRKIEEKFKEEMIKRDQEKKAIDNDPVVRFALKLLSNLSRGETDEIKKKASKLEEILKYSTLSQRKRKKIGKITRERKKLKKDEIFNELENILDKVPVEIFKEVEKEEKYTEIIASEALLK